MTKNIDNEEIKKFNGLSSHWWNKTGKLWTLHAINPLRLEFIESYTSLNDMKAIDIGCGGGILSESLALRGAKVTAIDLSEQAIKAAKLHALESNIAIDYQVIAADQMAAQQPQQFDIVTCMELLEHVPDPEAIIKNCISLVKPRGYLFFSTLNRNMKSYLFSIIGAEYILNMLPKGTHDYKKFITPAEMANVLRKENIDIKAISGITFRPLSKQFSLTDDISVNYLIACQKKA